MSCAKRWSPKRGERNGFDCRQRVVHGVGRKTGAGAAESGAGRAGAPMESGGRGDRSDAVDDEAIAELNEQYRGVAGPTDVLSFPLFTKDELAQIAAEPGLHPERPLLLGDVVISVETAR